MCQESAENGVAFGQNRSKNHDRNSRRQQTAEMCAVLSANRAIFPSLSYTRLFYVFPEHRHCDNNKTKTKIETIEFIVREHRTKTRAACFGFRYVQRTLKMRRLKMWKKINRSKLVSFRFSDFRVHKVARTKLWRFEFYLYYEAAARTHSGCHQAPPLSSKEAQLA